MSFVPCHFPPGSPSAHGLPVPVLPALLRMPAPSPVAPSVPLAPAHAQQGLGDASGLALSFPLLPLGSQEENARLSSWLQWGQEGRAASSTAGYPLPVTSCLLQHQVGKKPLLGLT